MTLEAAQRLGNELRNLVLKRTKLTPDRLQCPRERSATTPCTARDGGVTVILINGQPCCVGCEARVDRLLERERDRHEHP